MKAGARLFLLIGLFVAGCHSSTPPVDPARVAALRKNYDALRARFETAVAKESLVASAEADPGEIVVAIRSELIETLSRAMAKGYLDHVTLDLAKVKAESSGEVKRKTFLGGVKVGQWKVGVEIGKLLGDLRGGTPRVSLRAPDLIGIALPVDVRETLGTATLKFDWDSAALANVVCRDFNVTRVIQGRVLPQRHELVGALQLRNNGTSLTATPLFPNRKVQVRLDLSAPSWAALEKDLEAQNTFGKCGAFIKKEELMEFLHGLAARGIGIALPKSIFRTVTLPARMQESALVRERQVGLTFKAESLRVDPGLLWSSASVRVQRDPPAAPKP